MTATPSSAHAFPYLRATSRAPGFSRPIEFKIPDGVSAIRYCGLPGRAAGVVPLLTNAPSLETSMSSAYSTPWPNVPDAVITGFFKRRPRADSVQLSQRGGPPRSAPRGIVMFRALGAARSEDPHAAPHLPSLAGVGRPAP